MTPESGWARPLAGGAGTGRERVVGSDCSAESSAGGVSERVRLRILAACSDTDDLAFRGHTLLRRIERRFHDRRPVPERMAADALALLSVSKWVFGHEYLRLRLDLFVLPYLSERAREEVDALLIERSAADAAKKARRDAMEARMAQAIDAHPALARDPHWLDVIVESDMAIARARSTGCEGRP